MATSQGSPEPTVVEMEKFLHQYIEKINHDLKEQAERDSSQIIDRAKEEAAKTIEEARLEAQDESAKIIEAAKREAGQITKKSREESTKVIKETRENAEQIIKELVERGTKQTQIELIRTAFEASRRTSQIMIQANKSIEQIITETETNVRNEFQRLANVVVEAEAKLLTLNEMPEKEVKEDFPPETEEPGKPATPVNEKSERITLPVGEIQAAPVNKREDSRYTARHNVKVQTAI